MKLNLPTHAINYCNGVNYKVPIYWELYQNQQLIKTRFDVTGGMYNDVAHVNHNNHPASSEIDVPIGFNYTYTFKFWHLGKINLPILLLCIPSNSTNSNNRSGMVDNNAYQVEMGGYKQFDFILTAQPENWTKINCNTGYIDQNGNFSYNPPSGTSIADITGSSEIDPATGFNRIVEKLSHRIRYNSQVEWFNIATGLFTGARIQNTETLGGIANPFYIAPVIEPPTTGLYYHFNAEDYFDFNQNPAPRSPIKFCYSAAPTPAINLATVESQLMKKHPQYLQLTGTPYNNPAIFQNSSQASQYGILPGYLFSTAYGVGAFCMIFTNPTTSKAGVKIKIQRKTTSRTGRVTIMSSDPGVYLQTTITTNNLTNIEYISAVNVSKVYVFFSQDYDGFDMNYMGFNISAEFFCENNAEIPEPYLYEEDAHLYLGEDEAVMTLFETITTTTNYADLNTIPESLWQPTKIINLPTTGIYHIYGRATIENGDKKVFKIRSFTQS